MTDLCYAPAVDLAERIRAGDLSPVAVVDAHLDRIDRINDDLNAYVHVDADHAREQAREAERAVDAGDDLGPLHGVPVAIKDFLGLKAGWPHTFGGSKLFADHVSDTTAVFVERLEAAGAIVLGKTNAPEFAFGPVTDNPLHGPTANPFDRQATAGGSSGGAAAAVAAGIAPIAQGSDAGGSIRIPASFSGVYGLKPTFGRIPVVARPDGFQHYKPYFHFGPLTRTVADAALALDVMAGVDTRDPFSVPDADTDYLAATDRAVDGMDVAYSPDLGIYPVREDVRAITADAAGAFDAAGAATEEIDADVGATHDEILDAFYQWARVTWTAFFRSLPERYDVDPLGDDRQKLNDDIVEKLLDADPVDAVDHKLTDVLRTRIIDAVDAILDDYDVLVAPTTGVPAFDYTTDGPSELDGRSIEPARGWVLTQPFNATGHPVASIPAGFTDGGLPVGLQIVGPRFDEERVLAASAALERERPWHDAYADIEV